jgi:hypothetical protein
VFYAVIFVVGIVLIHGRECECRRKRVGSKNEGYMNHLSFDLYNPDQAFPDTCTRVLQFHYRDFMPVVSYLFGNSPKHLRNTNSYLPFKELPIVCPGHVLLSNVK